MGLHADRFKWLRKLQPQNNLLGLDLSSVCVYVCEEREKKGEFVWEKACFGDKGMTYCGRGIEGLGPNHVNLDELSAEIHQTPKPNGDTRTE